VEEGTESKDDPYELKNTKEFKAKNEFFHEICLPGMTEEFRLPLFFKYHDIEKSDLKIVFVCEEQNN